MGLSVRSACGRHSWKSGKGDMQRKIGNGKIEENRNRFGTKDCGVHESIELWRGAQDFQ